MHINSLSICPVCSNKEWKKIYSIGAWNIEECVVCSFAKINPLPQKIERPKHYSREQVVLRNTKKKSWGKSFSGFLKRFFSKVTRRNKKEIFFKKLLRYLLPRADILDIGCGDGSFLNIAKNKFSCTGVEISDYLAEQAKRQNDIKIIVGNFQALEFKNAKYDGITLISLLEHLDDPKLALMKCFDLLNKEGALLIKTVNYFCLNRFIKREKWVGFRPPDHIVYFTPKNLKSLLQKIGFKKIRISAWAFNDNMYCDAFK